MEIKWHNKIMVRMGSTLVVLTLILLAVLNHYGNATAMSFMNSELDRFTRSTAERLAGYLGSPMARSDLTTIQTMVDVELKDERITLIRVKNFNQKVVLVRQRGENGRISSMRGAKLPGTLGATGKIIYQNRARGSIELYVRKDFMPADLKGSVINLSLIVAGLNALILLILFLMLKKEVLRPMAQLTKATKDISLGRLEGTIVKCPKK
jgi:hypothetical protein